MFCPTDPFAQLQSIWKRRRELFVCSRVVNDPSLVGFQAALTSTGNFIGNGYCSVFHKFTVRVQYQI